MFDLRRKRLTLLLELSALQSSDNDRIIQALILHFKRSRKIAKCSMKMLQSGYRRALKTIATIPVIDT